MTKNEIAFYQGQPMVKKANDLLTAKYKSTLLQNQVLAISLSRIEEAHEKDSNELSLEARLYPNELSRLISDPSHIYRDLKALAKTLTGQSIVVEDGKGNFQSFAIIPNATYEGGVFTVKFNSAMRPYILGLEKNYTSMSLGILTNLNKNSSFRIYEILRKDLYKSHIDVNGGRVDVEYNVAEFKFMIGLANIDDPSIKSEMAKMNHGIDWDYLYEKLPDTSKSYNSGWADFRRYVILPAQKELLEKSDIRFEFEGIRQGRNVRKIKFSIWRNNPAKEILETKQYIEKTVAPNADRQLEIPQDMPVYSSLYDEYVGHNGLTAEDINVLLGKADYDTELVRKTIEKADKQSNLINYMGWMVKCIENRYDEVGTIYGSAEAANIAKEWTEKRAKQKLSESANEKAWEKAKKNVDFVGFKKSLEDMGFNPDMLEAVYPPEERLSMYVEWKKDGKISALM